MLELKHIINKISSRMLPAFFVISASLSMGACSHDDEPSDSTDGSIAFSANVDDGSKSRASVTTLNSLKSLYYPGIGLFGYSTGDKSFITANGVPDLMYNSCLKWNGDAWIYNSAVWWPKKNTSFFAYAPYSSTTTSESGIIGMSGSDHAGDPTLEFQLPKSVDEHFDLLYASCLDIMKQPQVTLNMRHAMSRISFERQAESSLHDATTIIINSVTITSAGRACLNLRTGEWTLSDDNQTVETTLTIDDFVKGSAIMDADRWEKASLTGSSKYLMIIPVGYEGFKHELKVNYTISTQDANLASGKVEFSNEITKPLDINFEAGKAYNLLLTVGKSIDIKPIVTKWETDDSDWETEVKPDSY